MEEADELLDKIIKELIEQRIFIEFNFKLADGSTFKMYAKSLEDARRFAAFLEEFTLNVKKKIKEEISKEVK